MDNHLQDSNQNSKNITICFKYMRIEAIAHKILKRSWIRYTIHNYFICNSNTAIKLSGNLPRVSAIPFHYNHVFVQLIYALYKKHFALSNVRTERYFTCYLCIVLLNYFKIWHDIYSLTVFFSLWTCLYPQISYLRLHFVVQMVWHRYNIVLTFS